MREALLLLLAELEQCLKRRSINVSLDHEVRRLIEAMETLVRLFYDASKDEK